MTNQSTSYMPAEKSLSPCRSCAPPNIVKEPRCPSCGYLRMDIVKDKNKFYSYLVTSILIVLYTAIRWYNHEPMFGTNRRPQNEGGAWQYSQRPEVFFRLHNIFFLIGIFIFICAIYQYARVSKKMGTMKWL